MNSEISKLFPVKKNCLYFNFASDGPMPIPAMKAVSQAAEERMNWGMVAVPKQAGLYVDLRDELARLFHADPGNFAFTKNTSEGVLLALLALDIKENENYIVAKDAFPTTIKIMDSHCKGSMRQIRINASKDIRTQVKEAMDAGTRALVLDWVHFFTGKMVDLQMLTSIARENNIFTIIDGIQGAGAQAVNLEESGIDFFTGGGHKWLLSPQGTGYIYVNPQVWERLGHKPFGWLSYDWGNFSDFEIQAPLRPGAEVMEYGTRSYSAGVGFRESLKIINELGIENIQSHNRELREFFLEGLLKKGYETIDNKRAQSASIVPFRPINGDIEKLGQKLHSHKVMVSLRNNYVRAAFHFINDKDEVQQLLDLL